MKKKSRHTILSVLCILAILGGVSYYYINSITSTSFKIDKDVYLYIDDKKNYDDLLLQIDTTAKIEDISRFKQLATYMKYPDNIKSGRYKVTPNMTIKDLITNLKLGKQEPIKLKFNNIRLKEDLAERLDNQLMLSKEEILSTLNDSILAEKYSFNNNTFISMFIPNTYEVYWDTSVEKLFERMSKEHKAFWTDERKQKAKEQGLTPIEVATLASIVEEECYYTDEYPKVAGLYLNRLRKGQLLQADPTVKYAVGDFSLQRILFKHLEVESPYNTYKNIGLPPGPIRLPSIKGMDAVLNPAEHNYIYMCAKEDFSGYHRFAVTHAEHERNANLYRRALNERKIYK